MMLNAAMDLADRGFPLTPMHAPRDAGCTCKLSAECSSPGKHPRINTGKGHSAASLDPDEVRNWWTRWPDANIAMPCGERTGMIVLDVDVRHGGDKTLIALEAKFEPLPRTVEAVTGGGGRHYYFAWPGYTISSTAGKIGNGLDIKADGGLITLPPSLHASGRRYAWVRHPDVCELADAPPWLLDLIGGPQQ